MVNLIKNLLLFLVVFFNINCAEKPNLTNEEIRWDWNLLEPINLNDLNFPPNFLWGTATSAHQIEGNCNCQWTNFEKNQNLEQSGIACNHADPEQCKKDIELIKKLKVNAYRFSVEWSKIEPVPGQFNQDVINFYHNLIDSLLANNITPMITLHHFTHPQWFEDLGAFENENNIKFFVRFSQKIFSEFGSKVNFWCTINEPGPYAFQGYLRGEWPPGKSDLQLAGIVSKNLILAHINSYKALKAMPNGDNAQIGICLSITQFDPYHSSKKTKDYFGYKIEKYITDYFNHIFYDATLQFFITGKFNFGAPYFLQKILAKVPNSVGLNILKKANVKYEYKNKQGLYNSKEILDFIGIQPYSHVLMDFKNSKAETEPTLREGDILTDMPYCIYPESLYRAINQVSFIGVPIYITENGIADAKDDRRELFIRRYLYAASRAIKDGYDVRGYFYWSAFDNFEWSLGFGKKFGLYEVDFKTQERRLRKGSEFYIKVIENWKFQNILKNKPAHVIMQMVYRDLSWANLVR